MMLWSIDLQDAYNAGTILKIFMTERYTKAWHKVSFLVETTFI